ncbi:hypothetical protein ZHAS_00018568 [Anopheles sinensis]|uniref:Uncharacterized protein n=1 Tax=Anopheles sinensis TaxID=74873 RepID=A0A084WJY3_ANOSI|nr:hypothetical protein ZHAS_00018568 [Anopheles sinensis]
MDELTRMYRIRKTGLVTPPENLRKIFDHFKQRNELMANETIAYHNNANDKKEELDRMQSEVQQLEAILEAKKNLLEKYHQNQMLPTSG